MTCMSDIESESPKKKLIDDVIKATKIGKRLSKHHLHPEFRSWAYLNHGKPTLDAGILFLTADGHCVGMYHLTDCSLMISKIGFGPGGVAGLTQFAHQMDSCDSEPREGTTLIDRALKLKGIVEKVMPDKIPSYINLNEDMSCDLLGRFNNEDVNICLIQAMKYDLIEYISSL